MTHLMTDFFDWVAQHHRTFENPTRHSFLRNLAFNASATRNYIAQNFMAWVQGYTAETGNELILEPSRFLHEELKTHLTRAFNKELADLTVPTDQIHRT